MAKILFQTTLGMKWKHSFYPALFNRTKTLDVACSEIYYDYYLWSRGWRTPTEGFPVFPQKSNHTSLTSPIFPEPGQLEVVKTEACGAHHRAVRGGAADGERAQPAQGQVEDLQRDAGGKVGFGYTRIVGDICLVTTFWPSGAVYEASGRRFARHKGQMFV